jgi:predicted hydrolase (HD superfamily)
MKHFAQRSGADADLWEAVGLLHDMDYERHPNQEQSPTEGHPFVGVACATELGTPLEEVIAGVIAALQADAERLGLGGEQKAEGA